MENRCPISFFEINYLRAMSLLNLETLTFFCVVLPARGVLRFFGIVPVDYNSKAVFSPFYRAILILQFLENIYFFLAA